MPRRIHLALCLFLACCVPLFAQDDGLKPTNEWIVHKPSDAKYTIKFPKKPDEQITKKAEPEVIWTSFFVEETGIRIELYYRDLSESEKNQSEEDVATSLMNNPPSSGKLASVRALKFGKHPGSEREVHDMPDYALVKTRSCVAHGRIYFLGVAYKIRPAKMDVADFFLDSFTLSD